ncbi:MAG TPA: uracil-DNA glycosylase family protein, partial [Gaiellaceae bacterium]
RGKRRIHAKPTWSELTACRPWLEAELAVVRPRVLVCLGASAAQSLLGKQFRVTKERGKWVESELAEHVTATIHPSAILRQRDDDSRHRELTAFVDDLKLVAGVL